MDSFELAMLELLGAMTEQPHSSDNVDNPSSNIRGDMVSLSFAVSYQELF